MPKNNPTPKTNDASSYLTTVSHIFFVLYLFVGFIPYLGAADYDAPEWLYLSILNVITLFFIAKNARFFNAFSLHKNVKIFFGLFLAFFAVGCFSMLNAVNVAESLVHLSRLINCIVALFCLFLLIRKNPMSFFVFICKATALITIYFSWKAVAYFLGNYDSARTHLFLKQFPHNYGNTNIYAAYLTVQLPFVVYGFIQFKKFWKYISGVAICMIVLALYFSAARTTLLSSTIVLCLFIGFILYGIGKHKLALKRELLLFILAPIVTIFVVLNVNRIDKTTANSINEVLVSQNVDFYKGRSVATNKSNDLSKLMPKDIDVEVVQLRGSGRFSLWNLAWIKFKENPILGIGYGNYKATGKKEHYFNYSHRQGLFANPRRAHNDFLEKMAETGIFGVLLYISLFIFPFLLFIKGFRNETQFEKRLLWLVILAAAIVYTIDALLNFPLERPPIQLYFIFIVIFILLFSQKDIHPEKENKPKNTQLLLLATLILVSSATVVSNYFVFKSYKLQLALRTDLNNTSIFPKEGVTPKKAAFTYQGLKKDWNTYPSLSYVGTANNVYLANYAIKEKKYEEALRILKNSLGTNVDGLVVKQTLASLYLKGIENLDSVKHYATQVFETYPGFKANFHVLKTAYMKDKDTANVFNVMHRYSKFNPKDVDEWNLKANTVYELTNDSEQMLAVLDTALAYNSYSNKILVAKKKVLDQLKFKSYLSDAEVKAKHQEAFQFFNARKYEEARKIFQEILKTNPKDYLSIQNIGIIDLVKKNYEKAIKNLTVVINANAFSDGKAEYSRAYCYEQLGQMNKAKADYTVSRNKKYPQAMTLPASKFE